MKETWHNSFSPDSVLPVSLTFFPPYSFFIFCSPTHVIYFPSSWETGATVHYEIILPENSMENLSNPS